jgi:hypothetical protein
MTNFQTSKGDNKLQVLYPQESSNQTKIVTKQNLGPLKNFIAVFLKVIVP